MKNKLDLVYMVDLFLDTIHHGHTVPCFISDSGNIINVINFVDVIELQTSLLMHITGLHEQHVYRPHHYMGAKDMDFIESWTSW
jgi:hypothetical protein